MQQYFICFLMVFFSFGAVAQTGPEENGIVRQILLIDSDRDGIDDSVDECFEDSANTKVDAKGCRVLIADVKVIRININFAVNSSVIEAVSFSEVEKVANYLSGNPSTRAVIEGHTDSDGSAAYNRALSQRRAQEIARLLVSQYTIDASRLTAIGFGESKPILPNNSEKNKAINRRSIATIRSL